MPQWIVFAKGLREAIARCRTTENKKADVTEYPAVFNHVGLLVNEPPGTAGLLFI
jgi:hypothetical protein